jgi:hypothetical protein
MAGTESEPNYPHEEEEGKKVFWYYDNIDEEVTPEVCLGHFLSPQLLPSPRVTD